MHGIYERTQTIDYHSSVILVERENQSIVFFRTSIVKHDIECFVYFLRWTFHSSKQRHIDTIVQNFLMIDDERGEVRNQ